MPQTAAIVANGVMACTLQLMLTPAPHRGLLTTAPANSRPESRALALSSRHQTMHPTASVAHGLPGLHEPWTIITSRHSFHIFLSHPARHVPPAIPHRIAPHHVACRVRPHRPNARWPNAVPPALASDGAGQAGGRLGLRHQQRRPGAEEGRASGLGARAGIPVSPHR